MNSCYLSFAFGRKIRKRKILHHRLDQPVCIVEYNSFWRKCTHNTHFTYVIQCARVSSNLLSYSNHFIFFLIRITIDFERREGVVPDDDEDDDMMPKPGFPAELLHHKILISSVVMSWCATLGSKIYIRYSK